MGKKNSCLKINSIIIVCVLQLTILCGGMTLKCFAGTVLEIDSDKQFEFAEKCFDKREFVAAVNEYKRFIHFFRQDSRLNTALYKIGLSYYNEKQFGDAIHWFETIIDNNKNASFITKANFIISECYLKLKEPERAVKTLLKRFNNTTDEGIRDKTLYNLGWIYLEHSFQIPDAVNNAELCFNAISNRNSYQLNNKAISQAIQQAGFNKNGYIEEKKPLTAGLLSIIPGAGQVYCDRYQDALIAFLVNSTLILAAYEAFDNGNNALGGIISFVEVGFYAGNIYGSVTDAHKINRLKTIRFVKKLKQDMSVGISISRANDESENLMVSLKKVF